MTIPKPLRSLLLLAAAGSGLLLFSGCDEVVVSNDRPGYYGGGDDVDFYYVSGRPYSHHYGELVSRDGGYYYNRGGSYVVYDRSPARHSYGGDRYRTDRSYDRGYGRTDYQRVDNERNYRNTTVNNYHDTNAGARSRNAPVYGQSNAVRASQGPARNPYVRTQTRGAQPVQGQPGQTQTQTVKKKVKQVTY